MCFELSNFLSFACTITIMRQNECLYDAMLYIIVYVVSFPTQWSVFMSLEHERYVSGDLI